MIEVKKSLLGGMNSDDTPQLIGDDEYLQLQNGRVAVSEDGRNLRVENLYGTTLLNSGVLPSGNNQCIGTAVDDANRRLIYFNWNSNGEHGIYAYDTINNLNYVVLLNSNLTFTSQRISTQPSYSGAVINMLFTGFGYQGDNIFLDFSKTGIPTSLFTADATFGYYESLASVLARLIVSINTNSVAIANSIVTTLVGTDTVNITFNGVSWTVNTTITLADVVNKPLNFSKEHRIDRNARVISNLLYWTDGYNQPRKVNIEAGIKTNQPTYVTNVLPYSLPIDYKWIQWIKRPPIYPFIFIKSYDPSYQGNFIEKENLFFTCRYTFYDNEVSALAEYSTIFFANQYNINTNYGANDNYNFLRLLLPIKEKISAEVETLELYVKFGQFGKTQVIKVFDKKIPSDAAAIIAHNNGTTRLQFDFYNDINGAELDNGSSINDQDIVPLLVKTFDIAKNRNLSGDNTFGYTSPNITSLTAVTPSSGTLVTGALYQAFKYGSKRQISITFYDEFKRKFSSVTNDGLIVQFPNYDPSNHTDYYPSLSWTLSNTNALLEIPNAAYFYSIDITDNLTFSDFIEFYSNGYVSNGYDLEYVLSYINGVYLYISGGYNSAYYGIAIDTDKLNTARMGYVYKEGDLFIINMQDTGSSSLTTAKGKVLGQDGNKVILELNNIGNASDFGSSYRGFQFIIYTPSKIAFNKQFYTVGNIFDINNPSTNSRQYSIIDSVASGVDIKGDVFTYTLDVPNNGATKTFNFTIELQSKNLLIYKIWAKNLGWVNEVDTIGQQELKTTVAWSDTFIQGSKINQLNKFQPLSRKELGGSSGQIQKLQLTNKKQEDGTVMLAICTNGTVSMYLGEVQLVAASSNSSVATSDSVIGTVNALKKNYGTLNPESVFEYLGDVFWLDISNGVSVRYASNGLFAISDYKLSRMFWKYSVEYGKASKGNLVNINGFSHLPTGIDPSTKEALYVLPALIYPNYATNLPSYSSVPSYATSIVNRFDLFDFLGKTLSFSIDDNKWRSDYEYMPEWLEYLDTTNFGFKNGLLYSHNTDKVNYNTFYGTQYPLRLMSSWNIQKIPSAIKDCYGIVIEGNAIPDFSVLYASYPDIQITDLTASDYTNTEGVMYAIFFRDRLSPNTLGSVIDKLYGGDEVKTAYPFVMLEFQQYNQLMYINFVNFRFAISKGQQQLLKG